MWSSMPGIWVLVSTLLDIAFISTLAARSMAMHSLKFGLVAATLLAAIVYDFLPDLVKVPTFRRFHIT
jgi:H+-transporting ATPase